MYLLLDRESRMGPIEQMTADAARTVAATNSKLMLIIVAVVVGAVLVSVVFSHFLSRALRMLADGMRNLVMLRFFEQQTKQPQQPHHEQKDASDGDRFWSLSPQRRNSERRASLMSDVSHVAEVSRCQGSFSALERFFPLHVSCRPARPAH